MALAHFRNYFIRKTAFAGRCRIPYIVVAERGRGGGRVHLHALIACPDSIGPEWLAALWHTRGRAEISAYQRERHGAEYLVKTLGDSEAEFELSRYLPPLSAGSL